MNTDNTQNERIELLKLKQKLQSQLRVFVSSPEIKNSIFIEFLQLMQNKYQNDSQIYNSVNMVLSDLSQLHNYSNSVSNNTKINNLINDFSITNINNNDYLKDLLEHIDTFGVIKNIKLDHLNNALQNINNNIIQLDHNTTERDTIICQSLQNIGEKI